MKKHLIISGRVQGVGFRYWLWNAANKKNIFGWVKNKISGDVETVIIGNKKAVNEMIKLCEKGSLSSNVVNIKISEYKKNYLKKTLILLNQNKNEHLG